MEKRFTIKSLASGKEFNVSYEHIEKMNDVDIMDDGMKIGTRREKYVKDTIEVEHDGKIYSGDLHHIASYENGKTVESCKELGTDTYVKVTVEVGKYLIIPISTEDAEKFEAIKLASANEEVAAYEKAEFEKSREEERSAAEAIIRHAENTIRNEDGTLMNIKQAKSWKKKYNDLNNEGGEGFVPDIITAEAVEWAEKILKEL